MHPAYYMHLFPDVFAFFDRATFFWENGSLLNLGHNEYQPGAIAFFISLSPVFLIDTTIETYKWALFAANSIFILLISLILIKMKKTEGIFLMSLLLVFLGPILLFRFDLLVIFLTILSFYCWEIKKKDLSMVVLAFAVITKVYPIIFLPYLLWSQFKSGQENNTVTTNRPTIYFTNIRSILFQSFKTDRKLEPFYLFFTFTTAFLAYLLAYTYFFQIDLSATWTSYNFHNLKSVATESIWATVIYFIHFISGQSLPGMESAYGINAIARSEVYPPIQFYNYFWTLPLGIAYLLYFLKNKSWDKIDYKFLTFVLLLFLIFSKVLSNQYLGWFLFMLPLIDIRTILKKTWIINIFVLVISIILHTYIYPLNYSGWLSVLTTGVIDPVLFWSVLISNFLLIVLALRIGLNTYKNND